jgi:hypothetical protein
MSLGYISYVLHETVHSLKKQKIIFAQKLNTCQKYITQQITLSKHKEELLCHWHKLSHRTQNPKNPLAVITAITNVCTDQLQLQSCAIAKKSIELAIVCPSAYDATIMHAALSASPIIANAQLHQVSRHGNTQQVICTLKAKMK